jgi:hypothetical protein
MVNRPRTPETKSQDPENQQWWEPLQPGEEAGTWRYPSPPPCKCWWTGGEREPTEEELIQWLDYLRERRRDNNQRREKGRIK